MYPVIEYFNDVESNLCLSINRLSHRRWIRHFFSVISRLGDGGFWVLTVSYLVTVKGAAAIPFVVQMTSTGAVGVFLYKLMKNRLVRERPYINLSAIQCGAAPLDQYSFPSGHTLHATSFAILLSQYEPLLLPVVLPFALLVAASRVILGLHYPSDVVVGAAIGSILASISVAIF